MGWSRGATGGRVEGIRELKLVDALIVAASSRGHQDAGLQNRRRGFGNPAAATTQ
jgi:hypothetical protein